jgi:class 3 adenylate cyclase
VVWLLERGFSEAEIREAEAAGVLTNLAGDTLHRAGVELSLRDAARLARLELERVIEVHRAAGFPPIDPDEPLLTAEDIESYAVLRDAAALFSWTELVQFIRVVGSSVERIAEASNTLFLHDVEQPLRAAGATQLDMARRSVQAMSLADGIASVLRTFTRLHLDVSIARLRMARWAAAGPSLMVPMAVGFVDLVGYTARTEDLAPVELAELVARFEADAHDVIVERGGRLVKLIGDEVMFVAVDPVVACDVAAALLGRFGVDGSLTPRGGLAYGDVLSRSGDVFGSTVNLASRLADQAVPVEVLCEPALAAAVADHVEGDEPDHVVHRLEPAGRRVLKGFTDPVTVWSLVNR